MKGILHSELKCLMLRGDKEISRRYDMSFRRLRIKSEIVDDVWGTIAVELENTVEWLADEVWRRVSR